MSENLEILNNDDVISVVDVGEADFDYGNTLKIQQLIEEYQEYAKSADTNTSNLKIFDDSIECEVLRHNSEHKDWRKGKIKFVVQFEPEEAKNNCNPNSLDDIRQQLDSTN